MTDPDSVRASDREREAAVERLRSASVEGRLTLDELTNRTEAAYSAQTRGELTRVTADLPEPSGPRSEMQLARSQRIVSVFANVTRSGWWRAEGTVAPMSLFGDVELDLRQAVVPSGEVEIKAVAPFGDIEVIVPDGVSVELTGLSVFGRKKLDVRTWRRRRSYVYGPSPRSEACWSAAKRNDSPQSAAKDGVDAVRRAAASADVVDVD